MMTITWRKGALKTLRRVPRPEAQRIREKVKLYAEDPQALGNNVKALTGSDYIRLRVGDWRVIMDEQGDVLDVIKIGPRGGVYK